MIDDPAAAVVAAFVAGLALGLFYFGGLWLTVLRLATARRPGVLTLVSMLLRSAVVIAGFWLVMGGRLERLLAAVVGFIVVRAVLIRRWGPSQHQTTNTRNNS